MTVPRRRSNRKQAGLTSGSKPVAHLCIEFAILGRVFNEIGIEPDTTFFKKQNRAGTSELKITFFGTLFHRLFRQIGIYQTPDAGRSDLGIKNGAKSGRFE